MFGEIYHYAADNLDMFNVAGAKIEHDEAQHKIKIKIPGVIIHLSDSYLIIKYRTDRGGYEEVVINIHDYKYIRCNPQQILRHVWRKAVEFSKNYTPPPKKAVSKKNLPQPLRFSCPTILYRHLEGPKRPSLNVTIETTNVISLVTIANNLKLVEVCSPNSEPWFFVEGRTFTGAKIYIVTDGEQYYPVRKRSYRVMEDWDYELSKIDKFIVKEAIKAYAASIAE